MVTEATLELAPIGVVRSAHPDKKSAPRQAAADDTEAIIELLPGRGFEDALTDIESWTHLWVVAWFHEAGGWRPKVLPPRSDRKRGVFATRSPHRPNPIGISVVRLLRVDGLRLCVAEIDLVDGTPVLDIKPYVAWADAVSDAGAGWLRPDDPAPRWRVTWSEPAVEQARWLRERGVELEEPVTRALSLGPQPHAYRRIKPDGDAMRIAHESWRVRFTSDERDIRVLGIASGYRPRALRAGTGADLDLHRAFVERFG